MLTQRSEEEAACFKFTGDEPDLREGAWVVDWGREPGWGMTGTAGWQNSRGKTRSFKTKTNGIKFTLKEGFTELGEEGELGMAGQRR